MKFVRHGKTITTDLMLSLGRGGVYLAAGRLDGGVNFRAFTWRYRRFQSDDLGWHAVAGPFDLMWRRRREATL